MAYSPLPTPLTGNPQQSTSALPVRMAPNVSWRPNLASVIASDVDTALWTLVGTGSGQTISQSGGKLVFTTGTTANSETIIRSKVAWQDNMLARYSITLSQRIANQFFYVELVDVIGDGLTISIDSATQVTVTIPSNPFTSANVGQSMYLGDYVGTGTFIPGRYAIASVSGNNVVFTVAGFATGSGTVSAFGWNYHQARYQGTTVTQWDLDAQRCGWNSGFTTATCVTTATGSLAQIYADDTTGIYADSSPLTTSSNGTAQRVSRFVNVPGTDFPLYLQIRAVNGSTAPASTTTMTINAVTVEEYPSVPVTVQNVKTIGAYSQQSVYMSQFPSAGTSADSLTNPSISQVGADMMVFNGSTWDRFRNNVYGGIADTGAKTASFNSGTQVNYNHAGAFIGATISAVSGTSPTLTAQLQISYDNGTTFINFGPATTALTAAGSILIGCYPTQFEVATSATLVALTTGATQTVLINAPLPRIWRIAYTIGGTTPSFTFTNDYVNYIL
mgnify:CR=1 FL=1